MSLSKEVHQLMKENGFWVIRRSKHLIWSNGKVTVVTAVSPSDYRAFRNIKRTVVKALRMGDRDGVSGEQSSVAVAAGFGNQ